MLNAWNMIAKFAILFFVLTAIMSIYLNIIYRFSFRGMYDGETPMERYKRMIRERPVHFFFLCFFGTLAIAFIYL